MRRSLLVAVLAAGVVTLGLGIQDRESSAQETSSQKVVVHLSHFTDSLHYPFMALKVADAMQQHGAQVTLFLDIEGTRLADKGENLRVRWGHMTPPWATCTTDSLRRVAASLSAHIVPSISESTKVLYVRVRSSVPMIRSRQ
jgi:predicted peroxiredoxin